MGHIFPSRRFGQPNPNSAALTCSAKAAQHNFCTERETQVLTNTNHIHPPPPVPTPLETQHSSKTAYSLHSSVTHHLFLLFVPNIATMEVSLTSFLGETANNCLLVILSTLSDDFRDLCISTLGLFSVWRTTICLSLPSQGN